MAVATARNILTMIMATMTDDNRHLHERHDHLHLDKCDDNVNDGDNRQYPRSSGDGIAKPGGAVTCTATATTRPGKTRPTCDGEQATKWRLIGATTEMHCLRGVAMAVTTAQKAFTRTWGTMKGRCLCGTWHGGAP